MTPKERIIKGILGEMGEFNISIKDLQNKLEGD